MKFYGSFSSIIGIGLYLGYRHVQTDKYIVHVWGTPYILCKSESGDESANQASIGPGLVIGSWRSHSQLLMCTKLYIFVA